MTYKRIMVPVDGSPTSNAGLREAVKLARTGKAKLRLVHVVDGVRALSLPDSGISADIVNTLRRSGRKVLEASQHYAAKLGAKPQVVLCERLGARTADAITHQAKRWRADLIVMGTHGRRGVNRLILGSDAELVARSAPVPLLLVRANKAGR